MKEEIKSKDDLIKTLTQEIESLKSTDTAIVLYESKFKELNEVNQKKDAILKDKREKIEELEQRDRQREQQSQHKDQVIDQKDAENKKIKEEKEELLRILAEAEKMLA